MQKIEKEIKLIFVLIFIQFYMIHETDGLLRRFQTILCLANIYKYKKRKMKCVVE